MGKKRCVKRQNEKKGGPKEEREVYGNRLLLGGGG